MSLETFTLTAHRAMRGDQAAMGAVPPPSHTEANTKNEVAND